MAMTEESGTGGHRWGLSLQTEGLLLLLVAFALVLMVPVSLLDPRVPEWIFTAGFIGWFFWFTTWASKGGLPPRFA